MQLMCKKKKKYFKANFNSSFVRYIYVGIINFTELSAV